MSDRITNAELKEVHSYLDEINDERFCNLMHKLLTTFNFLVVNGREWKEKSKKCTILEVELIEKKQEIITLCRRIEKKQDKIFALKKELDEEKANGERYFNAYKASIEREQRLKKGIAKLKYEIDARSSAENKKK